MNETGQRVVIEFDPQDAKKAADIIARIQSMGEQTSNDFQTSDWIENIINSDKEHFSGVKVDSANGVRKIVISVNDHDSNSTRDKQTESSKHSSNYWTYLLQGMGSIVQLFPTQQSISNTSIVDKYFPPETQPKPETTVEQEFGLQYQRIQQKFEKMRKIRAHRVMVLGRILGILFGLFTIICGLIAALNGQEIAGVIFGTTGLAGMVTVFIVGQRRKNYSS